MAVILTTARALVFLTSATHSNFVCARIHSSYPLDEEDGMRDAALFSSYGPFVMSTANSKLFLWTYFPLRMGK